MRDNHSKKMKCLDLTFENAQEAFKSKTFSDLIRGYFVFLLCSSKYLVEHNEKIIEIGEKILGRKLFSFFMKKTIYGHFVGGEDKEQLKPKLSLLCKYGVKSILDYSVEEDLSKEEAEEMEIKSLSSEVEVEEEEEEDDDDKEEIGGKMEQYKPVKEFADRRQRVESARTYFYESELKCDRNVEAFIESIQAIAHQGDGFIAIKITALGRPQSLLQLSEVIMRAREFSAKITGNNGSIIRQKLTIEQLQEKLEKIDIKDTKKFLKHVVANEDGVIHLFPWYDIIHENKSLKESFRLPNIKNSQMVRLLKRFSKRDEETFKNMIGRINKVICAAEKYDVRVLIDAEQTYFQPAISRIAIEMMHKYNTVKTVVFNTCQSYLKESFHEITSDMEQAKRQNFNFGCKLVRGAYLEQERERATKLGYQDPINPSFEATTAIYYKILEHIFNKIKLNKINGEIKKIQLMAASHNEDTNKFVIEEMIKYGIKCDDNVIFFAQLLGMCDYITFPLGQAGYATYKYVPYGPVHEVLPYLSRRARENRAVFKKLSKEKRMLRSEIKRRILKGQFFYKP